MALRLKAYLSRESQLSEHIESKVDESRMYEDRQDETIDTLSRASSESKECALPVPLIRIRIVETTEPTDIFNSTDLVRVYRVRGIIHTYAERIHINGSAAQEDQHTAQLERRRNVVDQFHTRREARANIDENCGGWTKHVIYNRLCPWIMS